MKGTGGRGDLVQGGHIIRSTGRKDRHSKVYTAKGPRDRRVRLSAQTAIQFYDVQDRLGYDRPSKAVDWLIKKAKNAIDKLAELPPWNPNENSVASHTQPDLGSSLMALEQRSDLSSGYIFQLQKQLDDDPIGHSSFMPVLPPPPAAPPTEPQCIADSMKSFFPTSSGTSLMNLQNYPHDVMSRSASVHTRDLGLWLHTMQESNSNHRASTDHQVQISGSNSLPFEANYAKTSGWAGVENGENGIRFIFTPQGISQHHPLFSQSSEIPQREPLQSNYSHLIQAWNNRSLNGHSTDQSSISRSHFTSEFQVPARIQGEEEPGVFCLGPSSSSISHY